MKLTNLIIGILIAAVIYLGLLDFSQKSHITELTKQSKIDHHKIELFKDSLGRHHGQIPVKEEHLTQLPGTYRKIVEDRASLLDVKPQDIKTVIDITTTTQGTFETDVEENEFSYTDGYLTMTGMIEGKEVTGMYGTYGYSDTLSYTRFVHKKKFLGITVKKQEKLDFYFHNPKTQISGTTSIHLKEFEKKKRFGIGPQIGVTYDGKIKPYVGFGLSYDLVRF
jgi:hypothetical protein